jgi:hypothetical protein
VIILASNGKGPALAVGRAPAVGREGVMQKSSHVLRLACSALLAAGVLGAWPSTSAADPLTSALCALAAGTQWPAQVSPGMVRQTGSYDYLRARSLGTSFQAVRLPIEESRSSLLIVLPDSSARFGSFVAAITTARLERWTAQLKPSLGSIALPRFPSARGMGAQGVAAHGMGLSTVQASLGARDCSGSPEEFLAGAAWGERSLGPGSRALRMASAARGAPEFTMTMDRPFLYAIHDDRTGKFLYVGVLIDPTDSGAPSQNAEGFPRP